ncbi:MAG: methyltransferase domain-containing protein [Methanomicrobiales archaeon]|nr:methyltransferase domain-containing protein [Methanomicrobiales archaeon]
MKQTDMDTIYETLDREAIPWNIAEPPAVLVDLIDRGVVRPCTAIDFGCGTGNYALYLAARGFSVTGIDKSPAAIRMAEEKAREQGIACRFLVADILGDLLDLVAPADFAYDWEVLHHIYPGDRERYVKNVQRLLNPGGQYLSVCFAESDPQFGGTGKYRTTPIGTVLYFSSERELEDLFSRHFEIIDLKIIEVPGKTAPHRAVYAFMRRS